MLVRELMTTHAVTVHPETATKAALRLLSSHDITSMPVVAGTGRLLGVVSEADLIRDLVAKDPRTHMAPHTGSVAAATRVADLMTPHAVTVTPDTDLQVAVDLMTSTNVKSLPVVDEHHRVVGMLSRRDVVRVFARADESLARDVTAMLAAAGRQDWMVEVREGVAWVSGPTIPSEERLAEALAGSVAGVMAVQVLRDAGSANASAGSTP